jgi:N-acyl-D-amino-acid deacylase
VTDVAIVDGRIAIIGDCSERDAYQTIDCAGFALAPGFIDVHSHSDELWLVDGRALGKITQGVTTEIGGNCGSSVAPLHGEARAKKVRDAHEYRLDVDWTTLDEFFGAVERSGVALNVATLVGLGTTRACISGPADRRLEREELEAQTRLVREAIEHGALGVSSGLIYEPSRYADLTELSACARAAREAGAPRYVTHLRDEGDALLEAVDEALAVGINADVAVRCSHHKAAGRKNWGKVHRSLATIDHARSHGRDVIRRGGPAATLARLRDPQIAASTAMLLTIARVHALGGDTWNDILITDAGEERNANFAGYRMDEVAAHWRMSPARAAIRLLVEEELRVECAFFAMSEDDVAAVLTADFCCIGSDASARAFEGPTARGIPHPRTYGCFPRVFGRFVRGRPIFSAEEAVRRMTALPADLFGIADRGRIELGAWADLVVFDDRRIVDRATYERPFARAEGLRDVFVNGEAVLRNGDYTGARPGRVLRGGR